MESQVSACITRKAERDETMSVKLNIVTQGKDLPDFLEWLAKLLKAYPDVRFALLLDLEVKEVKERKQQ